MGPVQFRLHHVDAGSGARRGELAATHGVVQTPAFMPVGTQASVKGLTVDQLASVGVEMVLANTYHLALRPGAEVVRSLGGLHEFMGWRRPILTDSGGFQVFSLADRVKITEAGASFRSHIDGSELTLTPESAVAIQEALGADVAMAFDHVIALPADETVVADAMRRSMRWAERCLAAATRDDQALFGIVQGGLSESLRIESAESLVRLDFAGYAIGGLSVGEPPAEMYRMLEVTCPALPADKPRYLMGVGRPQDLLKAIARGVDLFDCVMPTRNGRNALAFTDAGPQRLRNRKFATDDRPLEEHCPCAACRHGRGYLRHLFQTNEMLGPILLSLHNVAYYQRLLRDARTAIAADEYSAFVKTKMAGWNAGGSADDDCRDMES